MAAKPTYIQKLITRLLRSANQQALGNLRGLGGTLLGGDPGVGKTTFLELFSDLTGVQLITIEVPHIVEEHIINIPFLVYNPETGSSQTGSSELHDKNPNNKDEYDMVLADSHLFSQIKNAQTMNDQEYVKTMTDPHPNSNRQRIAQDLYKRLGGTEERIPPAIRKIRQSFNCILFFDEYFRETPVRIRNILRDTINGNLGIHQIPKGTFIVYASNMSDAGLEDIPKNTQMAQRIEFQAPSKDEWFEWLETKFKNDPDVHMKPEVINAFKEIIEDADMSTNDPKSEVRTSPRRWEQLLIYVNQSLPVDNRKDAIALLTNVKNNFVNYETGEYSEIANKVLKTTKNLIQKTSNVDVRDDETTPGHDWTEVLDHHIRQHMKSGKHRKYIPVISGAPGVGKTSMMDKIAEGHNLILIPIDAGRLNAEDVIGMPIPGERATDNSEMKVKFTVPQLYDEIERKIKQKTKEHFQDLENEKGKEAAKEAESKWNEQKWKYLIFFDELNRVNQKTFNSLRRIILEKNFGPSGRRSGSSEILQLPEGSIVVGAVNPDPETGGTESMTSHFRDVVDVIRATPAWKKTRQFMLNKPNKGISPEAVDAAMMVIDEFVKKFKSRSENYSDEYAPYFITVGDGEGTWVSPREYEALFSHLAAALDDEKNNILMTDMDAEEGKDHIEDAITDYLETGLRFPLEKSSTTAVEEFLSMVKQWGATLADKVYSTLISKSVDVEETWGGVLGPYLKGERPVTSMPEDTDINNLLDTSNNVGFVEALGDVFATLLTDDKKVEELLLKKDSPKVSLNGDTISATGEETHRLGNVVMGLLYTLEIHKYKYDRILAIGKSLHMGAKKMLKDAKNVDMDVKAAIVELRADIQDALEEIQNESDSE